MEITVGKIMELEPCSRWPEKKIRKLIGKGKTPLECLNLKGVSVKDKIWVASKLLPDKANREYAIWCARQCKTNIKEINAYIDVIEKFYNGEVTEEELSAADWVAYNAANSASDRAANLAADSAANWAAYLAAYLAADRGAGKEVMQEKQLQKLREIVKKLVEKESE